MSDLLTCSICTEDLTIKNVVNTECKHPTCKTCFWRWAKDKNTCPFCREHLLKNDKEAKDIQQMRELLDHRSAIVRQVEEAYEEEDGLRSSIDRKRSVLRGVDNSISLIRSRLKVLEQSQGGRYKTYKYFKKQQRQQTRINRTAAHDELVFSNYRKVISDIKSLSKQCPGFSLEEAEYIFVRGQIQPIILAPQSRWLLNHVRCMERKRKERRRIKYFNDTVDEQSLALDTLFSQEEEFDMPNVPYIADSSSDMDIDEIIDDIPELESEWEVNLITNIPPSTPPPTDELDRTSLLHFRDAMENNSHRENLNAPPSVIRNNIRQAASGRASRRLFPPYPIQESISPITNQQFNTINNDNFRDTFRNMVLQIIQEENPSTNN